MCGCSEIVRSWRWDLSGEVLGTIAHPPRNVGERMLIRSMSRRKRYPKIEMDKDLGPAARS